MYENAYRAAGQGSTIGFVLMCIGLIHTWWYGPLSSVWVQGCELQKIAFGELVLGCGIFAYTSMICVALHATYEEGDDS